MKSLAAFVLAFAFAPMAHAAVLINSVSYPSQVQPGQSFDIEIEVDRQGSGCTNNWGSTDIIIGGATTTFSYGPLDYTQGNGTSTATHSLVAPAAGTHPLEVIVYRGNEVNPNNCDTSIVEDTFSDDLAVVAPAPSTPSKSSSTTGGGGYIKCSFWDGWTVNAEHRCMADNGQFIRTMDYRSGNVGGSNDTALVSLYTQLIEKLTVLVSLL